MELWRLAKATKPYCPSSSFPSQKHTAIFYPSPFVSSKALKTKIKGWNWKILSLFHKSKVLQTVWRSDMFEIEELIFPSIILLREDKTLLFSCSSNQIVLLKSSSKRELLRRSSDLCCQSILMGIFISPVNQAKIEVKKCVGLSVCWCCRY